MKILSISVLTALAWAAVTPVTGPTLALAQPTPAGASADSTAEAAPADAASGDEEPQPMMGVELDDAAARGHFQVAQALFQTGRYIEAGGEFEQAYELSHRTEMLFNAFVAYRDGADIERAAEVLARYLEVSPEDPSTLSLRARLVRMQGRIAEQNEVEAERQLALVAQAEAERERQLAEERAQAAGQRADDANVTSAATRLGWVITTSGAGLIVASGVLALIAKKRVDNLETSCPHDRCSPGFERDRDRARRVVIATDTLWMSGAVVAALGFVLVLTAGSNEDESEASNVGAFCDGHGCAASYQRSF